MIPVYIAVMDENCLSAQTCSIAQSIQATIEP